MTTPIATRADLLKTAASSDLLDRPTAAQRLGISVRTLDQLVSTGDLPAVRIGKLVKFRPSSLDYFVEARESRTNSRKKKGASTR